MSRFKAGDVIAPLGRNRMPYGWRWSGCRQTDDTRGRLVRTEGSEWIIEWLTADTNLPNKLPRRCFERSTPVIDEAAEWFT